MAGSPSLESNPTIRVRSPPLNFGRSSPSSSSASLAHQLLSSSSSSITSAPMSIPNSHTKSPPPPLPPPRFVEGFSDPSEPAYHFANSHQSSPDHASPASPSSASAIAAAAAAAAATANVKSGSSLLGGHIRSPSNSYAGPKKNIDFGQGDSHPSPANDRPLSAGGDALDSAQSDQRIPDLAALLEYNKLQGENRMGQRSNATSSHAYDKQVLSRIGGPRTPPRSAGGEDQQQPHPTSPSSFKQQLIGQLRPLSLPDRRPSEADQQQRWTPNTGSAPTFSPGLSTLQSPTSEQPSDRKQHRPTGSFTGADGRPHPNSYEQVMFGGDHESAVEDGPAQDHANSDRSPSGGEAKTGQKRRAQSPPSDSIDPNLRGGSSDWSQRHAPSGERHSAAARLHEGQPPSLSSTVSSGPSQGGSYASSFGINSALSSAMGSVSTAATSYASDRPSPSAYAHAANSMQPPSTPHSQHTPQPVLQGSAPPTNGAQPLHARQISSGMIRPPGVWICDCCPKKPKKFESEQDLRNHESEKQYVCHYCHNRFKNKNEAERHQNSLHLRRHSWSCAALQSFENAFHPTPNPTLATAVIAHAAATSTNPPPFPPPAATDTCGYCGQEFANPPEWDVRVEHLNHAHKFGECNQSKKFFRADHFRQHLKHSHAGTSGRWTNMLENACMREEAPPQPISQGQVQQIQMGAMPSPMQGVSQVAPASMQSAGTPGPPPQAQMASMVSSPAGQPQNIGQRIEQTQQGSP